MQWQIPNYQQLLRILKNPTYAGAFAYGRTGARSKVVQGRTRKTSGHKVPMDDWQVLLKEHHASYISWENYMENQEKLRANRTKSHQVSTGAARNGTALLAGLLRCARCGHKLHVKYRGKKSSAPCYFCPNGEHQTGKPYCFGFGGIRADQAVADTVIQACQPMAIEASYEAIKNNLEEQQEKIRSIELSLERARYEADRARRQYNAVDPENRLVAAELESRWNASMEHAEQLQQRLESEQQHDERLNNAELDGLLKIASDLDEVWNDPAAPVELKKRILRTALFEIIVNVNHDTDQIEMQLHWHGGLHTGLNVKKNKSGTNFNHTDKSIVEMVKVYAQAWSDTYIASLLNRLGYTTGPGNNWNETRVKNLRLYHKMPVYSQAAGRSWITMSEASKQLEVGFSSIRTMIKHKLLPAKQLSKGAPWLIEQKDLERKEVIEYIQYAKAGKNPQHEDKTQTLLPYL